jgi:hypothetical protein
MKLPDFSVDLQLNSLRERIGAPLRQYEAASSSGMLTVEEIEILAREGLDIPLQDVTVLEDGTLVYKNRRVVLYIRDVKQPQNRTRRAAAISRFQLRQAARNAR